MDPNRYGRYTYAALIKAIVWMVALVLVLLNVPWWIFAAGAAVNVLELIWAVRRSSNKCAPPLTPKVRAVRIDIEPREAIEE